MSFSGYTESFLDQLSAKKIRIPITKRKTLFSEIAVLGKHLIFLHTYGLIYRDQFKWEQGSAKCIKAVEDELPNSFNYDPEDKTLRVGKGAFAPVSQEMWDYEVSGFKVLQSWLGYRMKDRKGRKSSPLDDIRPANFDSEYVKELLKLLTILEKTIESQTQQESLFDRVLKGEIYSAGDFLPAPEEMKKALKVEIKNSNQTSLL
jgi:hypothetical protein